MKKKLTLLFSFLLIGLLVNGQSLQSLKNGIIIKGNHYFANDFSVDFQTFILDSVTIEIGQIFRKSFSPDSFNCRAIIRTKIKNKLIDELYFKNIEPVGGSYGICFDKNQPNGNYIIGSKYGDYDGLIIIIDSKGKIINDSGGNYFITTDKKYLISDWDSDLSGLTVFDLKKDKIIYSKELPVYLSGWYEKAGNCYSAESGDTAITNNIYELNLSRLTFSKTKLNLSKLHQFKRMKEIGCEPN